MCVGGGATACVGNITNAERLGYKASEKMQGPVFPRCQGKSVASKCEAGGIGICRIKQSQSGSYYMRTWQDLHPGQGHQLLCEAELQVGTVETQFNPTEIHRQLHRAVLVTLEQKGQVQSGTDSA